VPWTAEESAIAGARKLPLGPIAGCVYFTTGKIAYLVVARGGIFGFDETRIPIPWDDFKATPNASLLVLDTTKTALDAAPKVEKNAFVVSGKVGSESQKVDTYWNANQPAKAVN
jgi:hypothetical protein